MIKTRTEKVEGVVKGFIQPKPVSRRLPKYGDKFIPPDHSLGSKVWKEEEWRKSLSVKIWKKKLIE